MTELCCFFLRILVWFLQQIGAGHFSRVFKVLKRMDGCLYAVKHSTRKLYLDSERYNFL